MPEQTPARQPRRLWLFLPFVLLLIGVLAWTGYWFWMRGQVEARLDAAQADLRRAGYDVSWESRRVGGYPYRMNVTLTGARARDASGWALAAPRMEAQTYMLSAGRWMIAATEGLTFTRPQGGPVAVTGEVLRASLTHLERRPPNLSFEGAKLAFAAGAGARPFPLTTAERVEFHLRAGPDDEGGVFASVEGGKAAGSGLFARIADGGPVSIAWESTLSRMSAFEGANWAQAVRAWTDAGGQINVRRAGLTAGKTVVGAERGTLTVGHDGRLRGALDINLQQAPRALEVLGDTEAIPPEAAAAAAAVVVARQQGDAARATLTFQAGRTTLGPVAVAPAPRVY